MYEIKNDAHPHSTEQDIQPISFLISKQVVPYQTRGGTCCPMVFSTKIQSLADSSTKCHDAITISIIPTIAQTRASILILSPRTLMGGRPQHSHKDTSQLNITKDGNTCMTLKTEWSSITNQV
jgi:hypothetical protein